MTKLNSQFAEVLSPLTGALMFRGVISDAYNHVIPSQPIEQNVLKTKKNTAATTEAALLCLGAVDAHWVPQRTAIVAACPKAEKIINLRLPKRSTVKNEIHDAMKYSVPLHAARMREVKGLMPKKDSKTMVA